MKPLRIVKYIKVVEVPGLERFKSIIPLLYSMYSNFPGQSAGKPTPFFPAVALALYTSLALSQPTPALAQLGADRNSTSSLEQTVSQARPAQTEGEFRVVFIDPTDKAAIEKIYPTKEPFVVSFFNSSCPGCIGKYHKQGLQERTSDGRLVIHVAVNEETTDPVTYEKLLQQVFTEASGVKVKGKPVIYFSHAVGENVPISGFFYEDYAKKHNLDEFVHVGEHRWSKLEDPKSIPRSFFVDPSKGLAMDPWYLYSNERIKQVKVPHKPKIVKPRY